ncbi:CAP domain-containing protein [Streptomyces sp. NPDC050504]|uniref:CAP domain-containing protein n=1 Tax=Streptomyces sp. NPDC050504 TaxID=3365618 RepID=UPI0037AEBE56
MSHALATAAAALALAAFGTSAPAHAAPEPEAQAPVQAGEQRAYYPDVDWIVCRINEERVRAGLAPLAISDVASGVAKKHAADMAGMGRLASVGSDGRDLRTRLGDAGLYSRDVAEHMLFGYHHDGYFADRATDPDSGSTFYRTLTNPDMVAIGVGYADRYWDVDLLGPHRRLVTRPAVCAE